MRLRCSRHALLVVGFLGLWVHNSPILKTYPEK